MPDLPSVVVMLSGRGSNLQAIVDYAARVGSFRIAGVISDQPAAGGLLRAAAHAIPTCVCPLAPGTARERQERDVAEALTQWAADVVALAGYMRILGPRLVSAFEGRMINIHPSLLPAYRGLHTYRRALADRVAQHGTSVHYVSEDLDGGPVIAQAATAIGAADDEQTLRDRVQAMEHRLYPRVIDAACRKELELAGAQVRWQGAPLAAPLSLELLEELYR